MVKTATIRDVASMAEVSPSTVSAVLNNKRYVRSETAARVRAAMSALNYSPRRTARDLATGCSGNIGFIISEQFFSLSEQFYTRVFLGAEFEARSHDLYVLLTTIENEYKSPGGLPRFLVERNVDGVIIAGKVSSRMIRDIMDRNVPLVLVDFDDHRFRGSRVLMNNEAGVIMAVDHLLALGHRAIGFVGAQPHHPSLKERISGFRSRIKEAGLELRDSWVDTVEPDMSVDGGERSFERIWSSQPHPTALVCSNDPVAIGVLRAAKRKNLKLPEDISIVGFDDIIGASLVDPPLTTIRVFKEDLGAEAVRLLVNTINKKNHRSMKIRMDVDLVQRGSTAESSLRKTVTRRIGEPTETI